MARSGSASSPATGSARITTAGTIDETRAVDGMEPEGIASGPDGNIWFTEVNTDRIGEFVLAH